MSCEVNIWGSLLDNNPTTQMVAVENTNYALDCITFGRLTMLHEYREGVAQKVKDDAESKRQKRDGPLRPQYHALQMTQAPVELVRAKNKKDKLTETN